MLAGMWPGQLSFFNVGRDVAWLVEFLTLAGMWPGKSGFACWQACGLAS